MRDFHELDQAVHQFRQATVSSAPTGFAKDVVAQLSQIRESVHPAYFFGLTSLAAAAVAVLCTLSIIHHDDERPPSLPEFSSRTSDQLFSAP